MQPTRCEECGKERCSKSKCLACRWKLGDLSGDEPDDVPDTVCHGHPPDEGKCDHSGMDAAPMTRIDQYTERQECPKCGYALMYSKG